MGKQETRVLLVGAPGAVALAAARSLLASGVHVHALGPGSRPRGPWASVKRKFPEQFAWHAGAPDHIDFGLSGAVYTELAASVHQVFCLHTAAVSPERGFHGRLARELVELAKAMTHRAHIVYLSSLAVAHGFKGVFAEHDQSVPSASGGQLAEGHRMVERVLGRFSDDYGVCVVRGGNVVAGDDPAGALFPLATFALGEADAFHRRGHTLFPITTPAGVGDLCAALVGRPILETLHFFGAPPMDTASFARHVYEEARRQVPDSYDVAAAARRKLREGHFTVKEFFAHNECTAQVTNRWTVQQFERALGRAIDAANGWEQVVEREVEKIVGFR